MIKRTVIALLVLSFSVTTSLLMTSCGGSSSAAKVLFVDDDSGMNNFGYRANVNPDVDHIYTGDLKALGIKYAFFRVTGLNADGPDLDTLKKYDVVIWTTGASYDESSINPVTLSSQDQDNLSAYLESGGRLFLSSQDVLYDMMGGDTAGTVPSPFANTYLGVLDAVDEGALMPTTLGVSGDPVSDGLVFTGIDADDDDIVDGFETSSVLGSETGIFQYDSVDATALTLIADVSTGFASTVFDGGYGVDELTDDALSFDGHSFWAYTDGAVSVVGFWFEPLGTNHYATLDFTGEPYFYKEYDGIIYYEYTDILNDTNPFPAQADTLLVDINGAAVATRVEQDPWKVVFLAFPYEGLGPVSDRRDFLKAALDWLQQ